MRLFASDATKWQYTNVPDKKLVITEQIAHFLNLALKCKIRSILKCSEKLINVCVVNYLSCWHISPASPQPLFSDWISCAKLAKQKLNVEKVDLDQTLGVVVFSKVLVEKRDREHGSVVLH